MMEMIQLGLMVKVSNNDSEVFPSATSWGSTADGGLILYRQDKAADPVALFAPGAWLAVFEFPQDSPPAVPKAIDGHGHGKAYLARRSA